MSDVRSRQGDFAVPVPASKRATFRRGRRWRRLGLSGGVGLALTLFAIAVATVGVLVMPHDPTELSPRDALLPPFPLAGFDPAHLLGTDNLGRDMLSRLIKGSQISLLVGVCAVAVSGAIGLAVGVVAGYLGGWVDAIAMRVVDAFLAIPSILLILVVMGVFAPNVITLILVLGATSWIVYARQIRTEVLEIRERQFVKAAKTIGTPRGRIMWTHILPNVMPTFIVISTLSVATLIVTESSLSFLGLGVQPPEVSWGIMLTSGRDYLTSGWWISTFPGIAITLTVLGILLLGDWLRDALDPKLATEARA